MTPEDKLRDTVQMAHDKQQEYISKYDNLHILYKSEKGMNAYLKEQITTLEFAVSELNKLNEDYIKQIGKLKLKLRTVVDNNL